MLSSLALPRVRRRRPPSELERLALVTVALRGALLIALIVRSAQVPTLWQMAVDLLIATLSAREIQRLWPVLAAYLRQDERAATAPLGPHARVELRASILLSVILLIILVPAITGVDSWPLT